MTYLSEEKVMEIYFDENMATELNICRMSVWTLLILRICRHIWRHRECSYRQCERLEVYRPGSSSTTRSHSKITGIANDHGYWRQHTCLQRLGLVNTCTVFLSDTFALLNVMCKQYHSTTLNPFLIGTKTVTLTVHVNERLVHVACYSSIGRDLFGHCRFAP